MGVTTAADAWVDERFVARIFWYGTGKDEVFEAFGKIWDRMNSD